MTRSKNLPPMGKDQLESKFNGALNAETFALLRKPDGISENDINESWRNTSIELSNMSAKQIRQKRAKNKSMIAASDY